MKVELDPRVVELIKKKGANAIRIWSENCGGWGGGAIQPLVRVGEPIRDKDDDDKYTVDGIDVFVRVDIQPEKETIFVDYFKILWIERMTLRGIRL